MTEFKYVSNVSDAEFRKGIKQLREAIAKKDTPEEWRDFTVNSLIFVSKIAISSMGYGPVLKLVENIFGDDAELIIKLITMLGEQRNENF